MPSELFDPTLELALAVAKTGRRAKPPIPSPPKVAPILKFKKVPAKAKEALYETLESDEDFRARVAEAATEAKVGRIGMMFLERPDGWQDFVDTMVGAAEEPVIESSGQIARLEEAVAAAKTSRDDARAGLVQTQKRLSERDDEIEELRAELETVSEDLKKVKAANLSLIHI